MLRPTQFAMLISKIEVPIYEPRLPRKIMAQNAKPYSLIKSKRFMPDSDIMRLLDKDGIKNSLPMQPFFLVA